MSRPVASMVRMVFLALIAGLLFSQRTPANSEDPDWIVVTQANANR